MNDNKHSSAIRDLFSAIQLRRIWLTLAWSDISQRYRRSTIGPFWITISTALMVVIIGPLYGSLFGQKLHDFYPYVATGIVLWGLVSGILNETCQSFIASESFIKELSLPFSLYVFRVVWRNLIIFGHNILALIPLLFWFGKGDGVLSFLWVPGIFFIALNGALVGVFLATICTRFRDLPLIVQNILQIAIFVTPIMWPAGMLKQYAFVAELNPIYHFIESVRNPLLGVKVDATVWIVLALFTALNFLLALYVLQKYKRRIPYWL